MIVQQQPVAVPGPEARAPEVAAPVYLASDDNFGDRGLLAIMFQLITLCACIPRLYRMRPGRMPCAVRRAGVRPVHSVNHTQDQSNQCLRRAYV